MRARGKCIRAAWVLLLGCASDARSDGAAEATALSASGMLLVNVRTLDGAPPTRGANPFGIEVVRSDDGAALDGLLLTVTPWMPAMGHGTSVRPTVTEAGGGHYTLENVYLFMPGLWELRVSIAGPLEDDAAPRFQIR